MHVVEYRTAEGKRQVQCVRPQEIKAALIDAKLVAIGKVRVKEVDGNGHANGNGNGHANANGNGNGQHSSKPPRDRACQRRAGKPRAV